MITTPILIETSFVMEPGRCVINGRNLDNVFEPPKKNTQTNNAAQMINCNASARCLYGLGHNRKLTPTLLPADNCNNQNNVQGNNIDTK